MGTAMSGLVRKVTLAMAKINSPVAIFSKATTQLNNSVIIFFNVFKKGALTIE